MKTTDLQTILRLDSIYNLLTFTERLHIRGMMLGWHWASFPERLQPLINWLVQSTYTPPDLVYGQDRLAYVVEGEERVLVKEYAQQTSGLHNNFKMILTPKKNKKLWEK